MGIAEVNGDDGAGASGVRRPRWRMVGLPLALVHLFGACYTYVPPRTTPTGGEAISVDLTDAGRVAHAAALGPAVLNVVGALQGMDGDRYVVNVSAVTPIRGQELPVSGIKVTLAPQDVTDLRVRTLSRKRTALTIGIALAGVVTFLVTKGFKSGSTPPEGTPGGGPDQ